MPIPTVRSGRLRTSARILKDPRGAYLQWHGEHGDTFLLKAANGDVVCTASPEGAKQVFSLRSEDSRPFAVDATEPVVGPHSVLLLHGEAHRRERRVLMPAFHGPRMKAYGDTIQLIARERIATWTPGRELVVLDEMIQITFRVIVQAIFGVTEPARVERYVEAISDIVGHMRPELFFFKWMMKTPYPPAIRLRRALKALDVLLYEDIAARRAAGDDGEDILGMLLKARYEDDTEMPDATIRDELVTLLFAGHETTSIALAWCVSRSLRHPAEADVVRAALQPLGDDPVEISRCAPLDRFCKEVLRMDTVLPDTLRVLTRPLELGGHTLPEGTNVAVLIDTIHRRDDVHPEADTFRPARWEGVKPSPFTFMPFGGGARRCVGAALATYEMQLVFAEILRGPTLTLLSDDTLKRRGLTMGPSEGVRVRVG